MMCTKLIVKLSDDAIINADLTAVARSTVDEFEKIYPAPPPAGIRPIHVQYNSIKGPLTDSTTNPGIYKILLTVNDRYYNKIVYQLAHELCHIFADPRRSNWFVECCCELASLVLLDKISAAWKMTPPFLNWRSYAPKFKKYAQNHIRNMTKAVFNNEYLPDRDQLQKWLATASNSFKSTPNDRPRNTIIALMLRPVFEESINSWDTLRFLGQASISPPTSLTDLNVNSDFEFNRWERTIPEQLKEVVRRIGFLFSNIG